MARPLQVPPDRRRRVVALVLVLAALIVAPATASAQLGLMPIYALSPASGATLSLMPSSASTRLVFQSEPPAYYDMITGITFEVASQNVVGQDGTLSDDFNVDYDYIHSSDTNPSFYVTALRNFNFLNSAPGTFYYQFSAYTYATHQHLASPVFSFVWDPHSGAATAPVTPTTPAATPTKPDLSMSYADAVHDLRYLIRHRAGRWPTALRARCMRVTTSAFRCVPRFRVGRRAYAGRFVAHHVVGSDGTTVYWTGSFRGHRSGGVPVHWSI